MISINHVLLDIEREGGISCIYSFVANEVSTSEVRYTYLPPVIQTLVDDYLDRL